MNNTQEDHHVENQEREILLDDTTNRVGKTKNNVLSSISMNLWISAILVSSQSFLTGYFMASLNSCYALGDQNNGAACYNNLDETCPKGTIYNNINLSDIELQLTTALTILGAWGGSLMGNIPADLYGRKMALIYNSAIFAVGVTLSSIGELYSLFIGRFIVGIAVGIASTISPILLSEIASNINRGTITTMCQLFITIAIFLTAIIGYGCVTYLNRGWQYVQAIGIFPTLIFLVFQYKVPESPKWLLLKSRRDEAIKTLIYLRDESDNNAINKEIEEIISSNGSSREVTWSEVLSDMKPLTVGIGLMFFQAMTGINTVIFYSSTIFGFAGFSNSLLGTVIVLLVNFLSTIWCNMYIDYFNRKTLLRAGGYIMLVSLIVLSSVLISETGSIGGLIAVLTVLTFVFGFAIGMGAVSWVIMAEVISTQIRSKAMSLFLSVNWFFNFLIALFTISVINGLGDVRLVYYI